MSEAEYITCEDARLGIWGDAPSLNGARTAAIGAFACTDAEAGARLVRAVTARLAAEGFAAIIGPMDGDTWRTHRFVVESDGVAPFLMEPHNPPHYPEAFERAGFAIVSRYVSAIRAGDAETSAPKAVPGVRIRPFDRVDSEPELVRIHALSLKAFATNAFYKPISADRFLESYLPLVSMFDPELTLMAESKGELVGFLFGVPNYAEGQYPGAVILKTYASIQKGVGSALASAFHARVKARGFPNVIHALMHESNLSARHSDGLGARVFRRYALYGKKL